MDVLLSVVLGGLVLVLFWIFTVKSRRNLPPGPFPLPVIGNAMFMSTKAPYRTVLEMSKTYGPVMTLYLGWQRAVFLVGYDVLKEALIDQADDLAGRAPIKFIEKASKGYGMFISNGERWKQLRRFTLSTLRDFGMGRKAMETWTQTESTHLIERIQSFKGKPFDPKIVFNQTVANVICFLIYGERFPYDDQRIVPIVQIPNDLIQFNASFEGRLYNNFTWLMDRLPGRHRAIFAQFEKMRAFNKMKVEEHMKTLDPSAPRDFIDCFLLRLEQDKNNDNSEFHLENLWGSVTNLFVAGIETTSTTMRYAIRVFMKYPDVQKKMQEEIDSVIGRERSPNMEDRKSLPFTDAVIHEMQRLLDLVPFNVPHYALYDFTFRGYTIPKGTYIFPMLTSVLKDDKHWESPLAFNPQHFLDHNGNFKKNPYFMPFSAGKRSCVGESLARMELFIFLVALLQNFTFSCSEGPDSIDLMPEKSGVTNVPGKYDVIATPR